MPESRNAFIQFYRNAQITKVDLSAFKAGGSIGHMGYFRKDATPLWQSTLDWFQSLIETKEVA